MQAQFSSRWANWLARGALTVVAASVLLLLRPDLAMGLRTKYRETVASPQLIEEYLRDYEIRKLQIGAGPNNKDGWLNTDIDIMAGQAYLDASKPFPLPDGSFHFIYSEHVIEHINYEQGLGMLRECHRILAPGGKVRIATPDLQKYVELFREPKTEEMRQFMERKLEWHGWPETPVPECYLLNLQLREWGHQFVYTREMLGSSLEAAGFRDVKEFAVGESDDPEMAGLEVRATWSEVSGPNEYETMVLQAVR